MIVFSSLIAAATFVIFQKIIFSPSEFMNSNESSKTQNTSSENAAIPPENFAPTSVVSVTGASNYVQPSKPSATPDEVVKSVNAKLQKQELERIRDIQKETTAKIYEKMRTDEIASLQDSILNDESLLKKIEASGSGAADYKYIESNLQKRKARLKELQSAGTR